jgi:hypothetical protein
LIAGVYNYCDAWCERCVFQQQCRVYLERQKPEAALAEGEEPVKRLREPRDEDEYEYEDDGRPPVTEAQKAEFLAMVTEANNYKPTNEEARRFAAAERKKRALQKKHPLTVKGRAYMNAMWDLQKPMTEMVAAPGDPLVVAAFEVVAHHAYLIGGKTHRATTGLIWVEDDDEGDDPEERCGVQSDSNGCAKLLRIAIAESREAWSVLFTTPALSAEGLPASMLERLEDLDREIQTHFPRAMEFVRPGFDDRAGGEEAER